MLILKKRGSPFIIFPLRNTPFQKFELVLPICPLLFTKCSFLSKKSELFSLLDDILDLRNVPSNRNPEMSKNDKHALLKLTLKQALHYKNYTCQLQTIYVVFLTKSLNNTKSSFFKCFISLSGWWWKLTKLPDYLSRFSGFKFDFKIEHFIHKKCDFNGRKVIKNMYQSYM